MKKRFQLYRLPPILIVQLKRFQFDYSNPSGNGSGGTKIMSLIDYPIDDLDVGRYMATSTSTGTTTTTKKPVCPSDTDHPSVGGAESVETDTDTEKEIEIETHYQLYGVVYHIGILGGGHYMASARDMTDGIDGMDVDTSTSNSSSIGSVDCDRVGGGDSNTSNFRRKYENGIKLGELVSGSVSELDETQEDTQETQEDIIDSPLSKSSIGSGSDSGNGTGINNSSIASVDSSIGSSTGIVNNTESKPKTQTQTKWYLYNDDEVKLISPADVVSPAAYLLFYMRRDVVDADIVSIMNRDDVKKYIATQFESNIIQGQGLVQGQGKGLASSASEDAGDTDHGSGLGSGLGLDQDNIEINDTSVYKGVSSSGGRKSVEEIVSSCAQQYARSIAGSGNGPNTNTNTSHISDRYRSSNISSNINDSCNKGTNHMGEGQHQEINSDKSKSNGNGTTSTCTSTGPTVVRVSDTFNTYNSRNNHQLQSNHNPKHDPNHHSNPNDIHSREIGYSEFKDINLNHNDTDNGSRSSSNSNSNSDQCNIS